MGKKLIYNRMFSCIPFNKLLMTNLKKNVTNEHNKVTLAMFAILTLIEVRGQIQYFFNFSLMKILFVSLKLEENGLCYVPSFNS